MNFTDRTTYLAAVANWKLAYAVQSDLIRALRTEYHAAQRAFAAVDIATDRTQQYWTAHRAVMTAYSALIAARSVANEQLSERAEGKVHAQEQYLAGKNVSMI